jgi:hypothetical protein
VRSFAFILAAGFLFSTAPAQRLPGEPDIDREMREKMERNQIKALNKERQEALKKDTDKLYKLATELKQSVDKTNEHILSVSVINKADEIERLAKEIRKKMKEGY